MRYGFGDRDNRCGISTVLESRAVYDRHVVRFPFVADGGGYIYPLQIVAVIDEWKFHG